MQNITQYEGNFGFAWVQFDRDLFGASAGANANTMRHIAGSHAILALMRII
jgi:hypothetical protein